MAQTFSLAESALVKGIAGKQMGKKPAVQAFARSAENLRSFKELRQLSWRIQQRQMQFRRVPHRLSAAQFRKPPLLGVGLELLSLR